MPASPSNPPCRRGFSYSRRAPTGGFGGGLGGLNFGQKVARVHGLAGADQAGERGGLADTLASGFGLDGGGDIGGQAGGKRDRFGHGGSLDWYYF